MDSYIGQLLDNRYEILERIGVGGMAMVYKARCHRLNRLVAIKILREDLAQDGDFRRRFHDESKAVAMLSHPNIVAVYDVNRSSVSEYIVMELIDGITLKQYIQEKDNVINWRESLHFMIQIIKALGHAHSRGIIHRDIKPHNIMVLKDGSVKVADFGIARLIGGNHSTLTQEALGSVHYISPEQARGSRIDARSDLYSAGVVLYEMITGRLPFEGDSAVSVAIQHINSIPLTPREVDPELPEGLEAITMKAMASNVDNRYSSADEMLESLEEFRKNPSINFDYKMEASPLENLDPTAVTQVLPVVPPTPQQPPSQQAPIQRQQMPPPHNQQPTYEAYENDNYYDDYDGGYDEYSDYEEEEQYHVPQPKRPKPQKVQKTQGKKPFPWGVLVAVMAIFLFITGVLTFLYATFFAQFGASDPVYVIPMVKGSLYDDVKKDLLLLDGFVLVLDDTITNDAPEGTILSQTPIANTEVVSPTTQIIVVVSGGPEIITMINVENQDYLKAQVELRNMGLAIDAPTYEYHDSIVEGNIISFTPAFNTPMNPGDTVHLVISKGIEEPEEPEEPEEELISLPNFVGATLAWSEAHLTSLGLNAVVVEEYSETIPEGQIMSQSPSASAEVSEGNDVNLQVSKGIDPDTIPKDIVKTVTVPLPEAPLGVGEITTVTVTMDTLIVYTAEVDPALTTAVSFDVTGSGIKILNIFFDGMPAGTQSVDFDEVLN